MIQHIYSDDSVTFDMADVQHIEHTNYGVQIIFGSTKYNFEKDTWENPAFVSGKNEKVFLVEWHDYKKKIQQLRGKK